MRDVIYGALYAKKCDEVMRVIKTRCTSCDSSKCGGLIVLLLQLLGVFLFWFVKMAARPLGMA
jgi:hypothetical protein